MRSLIRLAKVRGISRLDRKVFFIALLHRSTVYEWMANIEPRPAANMPKPVRARYSKTAQNQRRQNSLIAGEILHRVEGGLTITDAIAEMESQPPFNLQADALSKRWLAWRGSYKRNALFSSLYGDGITPQYILKICPSSNLHSAAFGFGESAKPLPPQAGGRKKAR